MSSLLREDEVGLGYVLVSSVGKHAGMCPGETGGTPVGD